MSELNQYSSFLFGKEENTVDACNQLERMFSQKAAELVQNTNSLMFSDSFNARQEPSFNEGADERTGNGRQSLNEAMKIIVRHGKVIRRRVIRKRPGFKIQSGKLVRESSREKRNRSMAAKKAQRKLKPQRNRINRMRKISLRRRAQVVR